MRHISPVIVFTLLLSMTIIFPDFSRSAGTQDLMVMQRNLEERISPLVKAYDPKAMVFVKIRPEIEKRALPGTPFVLNNLALHDSGGLDAWKTEVLILSGINPFSDKVLKILDQLATRLDLRATFKVEPLPPEMIQAPPVDDEKIRRKEQEEKRQQERKEQLTREDIRQKLLQDKWEIADQNLHTIVLALLGSGTALLLLGCFMIFSRRSGSQALLKTLAAGLQKVGDAMEGGAGSRPVGREDRAEARPPNTAATASSQTGIHDYPEESIVACLEDCYWSESDGYAAFLWRRIAAEKKKRIVTQAPQLAEYVSAILEVPELDLGAIDEPYYLSPWPLSHIDNKALAGLVKKSPRLLTLLPSLRKAALPLRASEVVVLRQKSSALAPVPSAGDFEKIPVSPRRKLKRRSSIRIRDLAEESEILALTNLPVEQMAELASLGWLRLLPKQEVEKILSRFSARDLASAWIGPKDMLQDIENRLSPKKRETLRSYSQNTAASRESEAFRSIHALAIEWLENNKNNAKAPLQTTYGKAS